MAGENWLDVATAAAQAGKSERQIRRWCESSKLDHRMEKGAYLIDPTSLEQLISETLREKSSTENVMSDNGNSPKSENLSPSAAKLDALPDEDIRTSCADVREDSMPTNLSVLFDKLRTSEQAVRVSQDALFSTADLLFQRLRFEYRRNRSIENGLQDMIAELNLRPILHPRWRKLPRIFRICLPWALTGISFGIAFLSWF